MAGYRGAPTTLTPPAPLLQLAHVRVQLNEFRHEMEQCAARMEFARAEQVKGRIGELDAEKRDLQAQLEPRVIEEPADQVSAIVFFFFFVFVFVFVHVFFFAFDTVPFVS